jgi:Tfp pilus assembly protein FimT
MAKDPSRGVTLLELLVLLGLLSVLAGAAAPRVTGMMDALELRAGAVRLASTLVRARLAALADGRAWWVRIVDARAFEIGPEGGEPSRAELPGRVRFVGATSGGDVRFAPSGWAENATFTLRRDHLARSVVVNQRGRVRIAAGSAG